MSTQQRLCFLSDPSKAVVGSINDKPENIGHSPEQAAADARRCIELAPDFVKGYGR